MPRQIPISADQLRATQRQDLEGVVYVLSGTLRARRPGWSNVTFRWATQTFSGALGAFDGYLGQPSNIVRGQSFIPGEGQDSPAVRIPVRNLAFTSGSSLLQLIDDGVYAWEETEASLRVLYQLPDRALSGAVAGDYTFLVKDGFFGPPEAIDLDGFQLPLYSRAIGRNRAFRQPRNHSADLARASGFGVLTKDLGEPLPVVFGMPDTWYRPPTSDGGVRGYTVSAYASGATTLTILLSTTGGEALLSGAVISGAQFTMVSGRTQYTQPLSGIGSVWWIHRQKPVYRVRPLGISGSFWDPVSGTMTISLLSGLRADVPKGALCLSNPAYQGHDFAWCIAGHEGLGDDTFVSPAFPSTPSITSGNVAFRFPDGTIRPADPKVWHFKTDLSPVTNFDLSTFPEGADGTQASLLLKTIDGPITNFIPSEDDNGWDTYDDQDATLNGREISVTPPVWFDTNYSPLSVVQQPEFTSSQTLTKINYPTGGTGTNNANARDGNELTACSLGVGASITLTFNSAPAPFADGDTVESTLYALTQGDIQFDAIGPPIYGTAAGTGGVTSSWRFTQASPVAYNQTIRCVGVGSSGGSVVEVWWEHTLVTDVTNTRTADVAIAGGSAVTSGQVDLGAILEDSEVVFRVPKPRPGFAGFTYFNRTSGASLDSVPQFSARDPHVTTGSGVTLVSATIPYPPSVMVSLQSYFLGPRFGARVDVNSGSYQLSLERYIADDHRLNFVLQRPIQNWSELERDFALQTRSQCYYGPSGHEIVYLETPSGLAQSGVVQEFRLAGTPGANAVKQNGRSLIERTRVDEIVNVATILWNDDALSGKPKGSVQRIASASVALFGHRKDPRGDLRFWTLGTHLGHPVFSGARLVTGLAQFYADRQAFALTRFSFETAWPAFGVERGSPVRVVYRIATSPDDDESYRNVAAEVEEIRCDPSNGERYLLTVRALETPTRGLPAFTWIERFTDEADLWTSRLLSSDQWRDRWSTP